MDYYFVFIPRYLNDVLIENNERFQTSCKEAEYLYRLDIEGCCEDDYGKVKVVAKNENGESEKEVINSCFFGVFMHIFDGLWQSQSCR